MTVLTRTYQNGYVRVMTVVDATAGDAGNSALVTTTEDGAVIVTQEDLPEVYAQILALGLV